MHRIFLLAAFFYTATVFAHEPRIVFPGDVPVTPFPGHKSYLLSDQTGTPSKTAILEITIPGNTFGAPPHKHKNEDEHFYVIEGNVEFLDREQTISAGPGSLVVLPRGHLHGFWNLSDKPAKMLIVVTPGEFASFFDSVVAKVRSENSDNPAQVGRIIAEVAKDYDVSVHPEAVPESAKRLLPK